MDKVISEKHAEQSIPSGNLSLKYPDTQDGLMGLSI